MSRQSEIDRAGFVLVAALLAIVLIAALATGVLFATTEETRSGAAGVARNIALIAGESALAATIADPGSTLPTSIGVAGTTSHRVDGLDAPVTVYVTRLDSSMYWIVADASADPGHSGARRRVGMLLKTVDAADSPIRVDPVPQRPWSELF
ncbi:MAG: hypothetical protein M3Z18_10730 [Gemmatimonadota bacterium]|nr:hypothetical protein [Gemmatimonadota bacterium]